MNWLRYGFGPEFLEYHRTLPFHLDFSEAKFSQEQDSTIIKQAIDKIVKDYPAPYTLLCSGGVDSQAMILAWKLSGHPFKILTARYNNGINDYDLTQLHELAEREKLEVSIIYPDIIKFHETELPIWAAKYNCTSPHILSHMYIASHVKEGTAISSGIPIVRGKSSMTYQIFALKRYSEISGQSMVPYFWFHDQYLTTIFQKYDEVDKLGYEYKCDLYKKIGLNVIPQNFSFNGFERIKEMYDHVKLDFRQKVLYKDRPSKRGYDVVFRYALEKHVMPTSEQTVSVYF